jgi:hypothetical protein
LLSRTVNQAVVFSSIAHGGGNRRAFGTAWQPVVARAW